MSRLLNNGVIPILDDDMSKISRIWMNENKETKFCKINMNDFYRKYLKVYFKTDLDEWENNHDMIYSEELGVWIGKIFSKRKTFLFKVFGDEEPLLLENYSWRVSIEDFKNNLFV